MTEAKESTRFCAWWLCLWPGLDQLWLEGAWSGLAVAAVFSCLLNFLLLTTLVWTEWMEPALRVAAWTAVAVFWVGSASISRRRHGKDNDSQQTPPNEDLFPRALDEYLMGNWYEAETICQQLLRAAPRDVDVRLLLASLWRHTGRSVEARNQLEELKRIEGSEKWDLEITQELARLDEADEESSSGLTKQDVTQAQATRIPEAA